MKPASWSEDLERMQIDLEAWRTSPKYARFVCILFEQDSVTFAHRIDPDGLDGPVTRKAAELFLRSTSEAHSSGRLPRTNLFGDEDAKSMNRLYEDVSKYMAES